MKKIIITLLFIVLGIGRSYADNNPANVPHIPNIATLQALGAASAQYTNAIVDNYVANGGGGYFAWSGASTATADACVTFAANGVSVGRWIRQLNGESLSAKDCGAAGDWNGSSGTDDTATLVNWMTVCGALVSGSGSGSCSMEIGSYLVSSRLPFCATVQGDGSGSTKIITSAAFSGTFVWDFNCYPGTGGSLGQNFNGMQINLLQLGGAGMVSATGSSSAGGGGGASIGTSNDIQIVSAETGAYALRAGSGSAELGMFTGRIWNNLEISAPAPLFVGNNQDEVTFNSPRIDFGSGGATITPISLIGGTSVSLNQPFISINTVASATTRLVAIARNNQLIQPFFEGTTNANCLLSVDNAISSPRIVGLKTNITYSGSSVDQGLICVDYTAATQTVGNGITLDSYYPTNNVKPYTHLFSLSSNTNINGVPFTFDIRGNGWRWFTTGGDSFAFTRTGTTPNVNNIWRFSGFFDDVFGNWSAPSPAAGNPIVFSPITQPGTWQ